MFSRIVLERFEARKAKAGAIVNAGRVILQGNHIFHVRYQTTEEYYVVDLSNGRCNCADAWDKEHLGSCKHRMACELYEHEQEVIAQAQAHNVSIAYLAGGLLLEIVGDEVTARRVLLYEAAQRLVKRQMAVQTREVTV